MGFTSIQVDQTSSHWRGFRIVWFIVVSRGKVELTIVAAVKNYARLGLIKRIQDWKQDLRETKIFCLYSIFFDWVIWIDKFLPIIFDSGRGKSILPISPNRGSTYGSTLLGPMQQYEINRIYTLFRAHKISKTYLPLKVSGRSYIFIALVRNSIIHQTIHEEEQNYI